MEDQADTGRGQLEVFKGFAWMELEPTFSSQEDILAKSTLAPIWIQNYRPATISPCHPGEFTFEADFTHVPSHYTLRTFSMARQSQIE